METFLTIIGILGSIVIWDVVEIALKQSSSKPQGPTPTRYPITYDQSGKDKSIPTIDKYPLMFISAKAKAAYLKSAKWKFLRKQILDRDNHQCVMCESTTRLEIHHLTYKRLTDERLSDLVTLCHMCHSRQHKIYARDRTTDYSVIM